MRFLWEQEAQGLTMQSCGRKTLAHHPVATQEPWHNTLETRDFGNITCWCKGPPRGFEPLTVGELSTRSPGDSLMPPSLPLDHRSLWYRGCPGRICSNGGPTGAKAEDSSSRCCGLLLVRVRVSPRCFSWSWCFLRQHGWAAGGGAS